MILPQTVLLRILADGKLFLLVKIQIPKKNTYNLSTLSNNFFISGQNEMKKENFPWT